MKARFLTLIILFSACTAAVAQSHSTNVIDTPTAFTLERGGYEFSVFAYDNGGIEMKTFVGLHDHMFLGVTFNVDSLIGRDRPRANVPGVIARILLTEGSNFFPAIAIGYDSAYIGKYRRSRFDLDMHNRIIYGPYLVFTTTIYLFGGEQYINYGVRVPVQPEWEPNNTSYFVGIDIPLGEFFKLRSELERAYWNFRDSGDWLINFGLRFNYIDQLGIEFAVMYEPGSRVNRVLRIDYRNQF